MLKETRKTRFKIAIDIDDCIGDIQSTFCLLAKKFFNIDLDQKACISKSGKFCDVGMITREETQKIITSKEYINALKNLSPFPFAIKAINNLSKFADISFVTSRDNYNRTEMRKDIYNWINDVGLKANIRVIFSKNKGILSRRLGVDLFVEDTVLYAEQLVSYNIPVILIKRPWNEGFENSMVRIADSWQVVQDLVEEFLSER